MQLFDIGMRGRGYHCQLSLPYLSMAKMSHHSRYFLTFTNLTKLGKVDIEWSKYFAIF
jgi:hypothetical protein